MQCEGSAGRLAIAGLVGLLLGAAEPVPASSDTNAASGIAFLSLRNRADEAYTSKRWSDAVPLYAEIVKTDPPDGEAWFRLGRARSHLGLYGDAIVDFRQAIRLGFVDAPRGDYIVAENYALAGNPPAALEWLRRALAEGYRDRMEIATDEAFRNMAGDIHLRILVSGVATGKTRDRGWISDLNYLVTEIRRTHYIYRTQAPPPGFTVLEKQLRLAIPSMTDAHVLLNLQRLVAMLGDGHSLIYPAGMKLGVLHTLPLHLYWFSEGLYILSDSDDPALTGCRVLRIGNLDPKLLVDRMLPYMSHDNESEVKWVSPGYLIISELLEMVGAGSAGSADFTIQCQAGQIREIEVKARQQAAAEEDYDITLPPLRTNPQPLYLSNIGRNYWFVEHTPGFVYLQFNNVRNDDAESLAAFAERLRKTLARPDVRGLVLDLRRNNGGEATLTPDLLRTLVWFNVEKGSGSIVALIGRNTFSAAQDFTNYLNIMTDAIFVGEPTGSKPILVGDTAMFQLPYSGAVGQLAPGLHADALYRDDRVWISADVPESPAAKDYFAGRDPALDSAIEILQAHRGAHVQ